MTEGRKGEQIIMLSTSRMDWSYHLSLTMQKEETTNSDLKMQRKIRELERRHMQGINHLVLRKSWERGRIE